MKQTRHGHSIRGRSRRQTQKGWKKRREYRVHLASEASVREGVVGGTVGSPYLPRIVLPTFNLFEFGKSFLDQPGNLDAMVFNHQRQYTLPITHILLILSTGLNAYYFYDAKKLIKIMNIDKISNIFY